MAAFIGLAFIELRLFRLHVLYFSQTLSCLSRSRVDHRVKQLSEALMTELEANQSILLHGGPQSSRRAVLLLNKLGKAHQVSY